MPESELLRVEAILEQPFGERIRDTGSTFKQELVDPDHPLRIPIAIGGGVVKSFEQLRGLVFLLPATFTKVQTQAYENGWNSLQAASASGLAVGGTYLVCAALFAKSTEVVINQFPETTEAVGENHPVFMSTLRKAASGMPARAELRAKQPERPAEGYDVGPYDTQDSRIGKVALGVSRSVTAGLLLGPTPHVGIPMVDGHSAQSVSRRMKAVVGEATGFFTALGAGLSVMISNNALNMADGIKSALTNRAGMFMATGALIGVGFVSNRLSQRQERKALLDEFEADQA